MTHQYGDGHDFAAAERPKLLTHLPNEVLQRICEYILPDMLEPKPFSEHELHLGETEEKVSGWRECRKINNVHPRDDCTNDDSSLQSTRTPGTVNVVREYVQAPQKQPGYHNHLANFAPACTLTSIQVQSITQRPPFLLTVSNEGITFEKIRDAAPIQAFEIPNCTP